MMLIVWTSRAALSLWLAASLAVLPAIAKEARAHLGTDQATLAAPASAPERAAARERVVAFLDRQDVRAELVALGVSPDEAKLRVDALSDTELRTVAGKLDELPAGGNWFETLVIAVLVVFFVLLITDLLGLTDVYPFVNHPPRR